MRQVLVQEANDPDSATLDGEAHGEANRLAKTPWFIPLCGVLGLFVTMLKLLHAGIMLRRLVAWVVGS